MDMLEKAQFFGHWPVKWHVDHLTNQLMLIYFVAFELPRCSDQIIGYEWVPMEPKMGNVINGRADLVSYLH